MKKLLALLLALVMIFALVACDDKKSSDTEEEETKAEEKKDEEAADDEKDAEDEKTAEDKKTEDKKTEDKKDDKTSGGYSSAKKAAEAYAVAMSEGDAETFVQAVPMFLREFLAAEYDIDPYDEDELIEAMLDEIDEDDIIEIEVTSTKESEDYDDDEVEEILKEMFEALEMDDYLEDIDDVKIIVVEAEADGEEDSLEVLCVEIDGKWFAITDN